MSDPPQDPDPRGEGNAQDRPLFRVIGDWLKSVTGLGGAEGNLRESLEELIEEHAEGATTINEEERAMLLNLLSFGSLSAEDVMVPRADIVGVPDDASLQTVVRTMADAGHSRLPVFRETLDDVIGMVHVRDLLSYWGDGRPFVLSDVVRRLLFVPRSVAVHVLLRQMRATKIHMALVVDEHGGIDGLITIEDLVEEIVGDIEDEHDRAAPSLTEHEDGSLDADARVSIEELERRIGIDLLPEERDEEIDTLGGLVFELARRVPARGEVIAHPSGLNIEIVEADPRRVRRLRIRRADEQDRTAPAAAR